MIRRVLKLKAFGGLGFVLLLLLLNYGAAFAANSGFFRVERRNGVWWFITPAGEPFFSNGVNVVDMGDTLENYDPKNPSYAAARFYKTKQDWQDAALKRLKDWNFNTLGGWSIDEITKRGALPYTKVLHLGGSKYVPWGDMFGEKIAGEIDDLARRDVLPLKDDKNLIGYFTDNELGWWDDTIFIYFLGQPPGNKTRQVLIKVLRGHYKNDFTRLKRDFETGETDNFAALERGGDLKLKPGGNGAPVIDKFIYLVAQRYYKLVHDAVRRYDPNHLILGDRYPSWYSQAVARAAVPYVDVVSTNYMADWSDGNTSHFYLDSLYRLTGKPIIVSEYYMAAMENRSGNKNSSAGFPVVRTQRERAQSFRNNLRSYAELPYVVGAHWFQYTDEPASGRDDGEDYNMGLLDIDDRPYEELTAAAIELKPDRIHAAPIVSRIDNSIPRAGENAGLSLVDWNKKAAFVAGVNKTAANLPFADFYASWDAENLYLAFYAIDYKDDKIYPGNRAADGELMQAVVRIGSQMPPLKIRFGSGHDPKSIDPAIETIFNESATRATLIIKIPARMIKKTGFKTGDRLPFEAVLASHSRAETMSWRRRLTLGEESR